MEMVVFVPYSARSYDGICADVRRHYGGECQIVPLVLEGELPPGEAYVSVSKRGEVPKLACVHDRIVIANGGTTAHSVAAVLLAQRLGCALVNLQREGPCEMTTEFRMTAGGVGENTSPNYILLFPNPNAAIH